MYFAEAEGVAFGWVMARLGSIWFFLDLDSDVGRELGGVECSFGAWFSLSEGFELIVGCCFDGDE